MADLLAAGLIRDIPDFPKPGILFKDLVPILSDPAALREVVDGLAAWARERKPDVIVGVESRGFLFGVPVAMDLGIAFAPVRKPGKLPYKTISESYALEYGTNTVEMHEDAIKPGQRVIVLDDLLATGGTAAATARLVERLGGKVVGIEFVVELSFLPGRQALSAYDVGTLITY